MHERLTLSHIEIAIKCKLEWISMEKNNTNRSVIYSSNGGFFEENECEA